MHYISESLLYLHSLIPCFKRWKIARWYNPSFYKANMYSDHEMKKQESQYEQLCVSFHCEDEFCLNVEKDSDLGCHELKNEHHILTPFKCNDEFFSSDKTSSDSRESDKLISTIKEIYHKCEVCHKYISMLDGEVKEHMKIHTRKKPIRMRNRKCGVCQQRTNNLQTHLLIHIGVKPFACDHCDKSFRQVGTLHIHKQNHLGVKLFSCQICQKAFSQKATLQNHILVHTGEKPYSCDVCSMTFSQVANMRTHRKFVHSTERPHKCKICGKSFKVANNLKTHGKSHKESNIAETLLRLEQ